MIDIALNRDKYLEIHLVEIKHTKNILVLCGASFEARNAMVD